MYKESQLDERSLSLLLRSVFEREEKEREMSRERETHERRERDTRRKGEREGEGGSDYLQNASVFVQNAPVCTFKRPCHIGHGRLKVHTGAF